MNEMDVGGVAYTDITWIIGCVNSKRNGLSNAVVSIDVSLRSGSSNSV